MKTHKLFNLFTVFLIVLISILLNSCDRQKPIASFTYYVSGLSFVHVTNTSVYGEEYLWTFKRPDGTTITSRSDYPLGEFECAGVGLYTLRLHVTNRYGYDETEISFTITEGGGGSGGSGQTTTPTASFELRTNNGNYVPATITAQNTSTDATSYSWTLTRPNGTISTSTATNPSFECTTAGRYTVKLVAYGANNTSSTLSKYFYLYTPEPTATAYTITWLRLEKIPMLDTDNSSWDTGIFSGADPDIKFKIQNSTNTTTYYTSPTQQNVAESDFPISWYNVNTTLEMGTEYRIRFLDEDDGIDSDDIMANCVLTQTGYFSPGATSYTWTSIDGTIKFTIGLEWIYGKSLNAQLTQGVFDNKKVEGDNTALQSIQ